MLGEIKEENKWKIAGWFIRLNQAKYALHAESQSPNADVKSKRSKSGLRHIRMMALSGLDKKSRDEKERRLR